MTTRGGRGPGGGAAPSGAVGLGAGAHDDAHGRARATSWALHWLAAQYWRASGRAARNRRACHGGAAGLRIVVYHGTPPGALDHLKRALAWWRDRRPMATPDDVDDLIDGRWRGGARDRLLVTFDDGLASNYQAAAWLAGEGVRAVFFIIPSFLDRTVAQFVRHHEARGVVAVPPVANPEARGLATGQVREMIAMGHRIGGHNDAHRDLGRLHEPEALRYEIGEALDRVGELTGAPCRDFAVGFGQPGNLSPAASDFLLARCANVYMCHRGLNAPGRSPRFLLRHAHTAGYPLAFTRACLEGGADHRLRELVRDMEARVGRLPGEAPRSA